MLKFNQYFKIWRMASADKQDQASQSPIEQRKLLDCPNKINEPIANISNLVPNIHETFFYAIFFQNQYL